MRKIELLFTILFAAGITAFLLSPKVRAAEPLIKENCPPVTDSQGRPIVNSEGKPVGGTIQCINQTQGLAGQLIPGQATDSNQWVFTIYGVSLGFVNIAAIIAIVFLAFSQVLKPTWSAMAAYEIKKSLPQLIIGVILANFSLLIVRFLVDIANSFSILAIGPGGYPNLADGIAKAMFLGNAYVQSGAGLAVNAAIFVLLGIAGVASLLLVFFAFVFLLLPAIPIFVLGLLLFIRPPIIMFLAALAPLAFASIGFPFGQTVFRKWWTYAFNWIFMLPAVYLLLRITSEMGRATGNLWTWLFTVALFIIAIRLPFRMGGDIMSLWYKGVKGAAGMAWKGYGTAWARLGARKDWVGDVAKATNIYGIKQAYEQRTETQEKERMRGFRKGPAYRRIAGSQAVMKQVREDDAEIIRTFESPDEVSEKFLDPDFADGTRINTAITAYVARTGANRDEVIKKIMTGPPAQAEPLVDAMDLDPAKVQHARDLFRQAERLKTRRRLADASTITFANLMSGNPANLRPYGATTSTTPPPVQGAADTSPQWASAVNYAHSQWFSGINVHPPEVEEAIRRTTLGQTPEEITRGMLMGVNPGGDVVDKDFADEFTKSVGQLQANMGDVIGRRISADEVEAVLRVRPKVEVEDAKLVGDLRDIYRDLRNNVNSVQRSQEAIRLLTPLRQEIGIEGTSRAWTPEQTRDALRRFLVAQKLGKDLRLPDQEVRAKVKVALEKEVVLEQMGHVLFKEGNNPQQVLNRVDEAIKNQNDQLRKQLQAQLDLMKKTTGEAQVNADQFLRQLQRRAKSGKVTSIKDLTDTLTLWDVHESAKEASSQA